MSNFIGKKDHNCYGKQECRPLLAQRAAYFGWGLAPIICPTVQEGEMLNEYEVRVASTDELVYRMSALDLTKFLAELEHREVEELLMLLPYNWTLIEVAGEFGGRVGFLLMDEDGDLRGGTMERTAKEVFTSLCCDSRRREILRDKQKDDDVH